MVEGNTQHRYKEALTLLEEQSPGTKAQMYFGFLDRVAHRFENETRQNEVVACTVCGSPTVLWEPDGEAICSFCKTKALARKRKAQGYVPNVPGRKRARS